MSLPVALVRAIVLGGALLCTGDLAAERGDRPNILWITCEDTGPHLGAYGDAYAVTPVLDALARESVRYTHAFAYTGVCAPSRSCLISGVLPPRLGTHGMRSSAVTPQGFRAFPAHLRDAGYHATNNAKEDYNFTTPKDTWDESSPRAHWRSRPQGRPFFAVFNFGTTHQSRIFGDDAAHRERTRRLTADERRDPALAPLPPFHPDLPGFRREWARHYENVTVLDHEVGDLLAELEADGLADDTIVFFFSDHGTGMPGIKMFAWGPGLHVPLLIRFPEKWKHLAPAAAGATTDRLVGFVDFAPTVLSLTGIEAPPHFQGGAFLGPHAGPPRRLLFGGKDRQAEADDTIRTVRDHRLQYIRNFQSWLPYGQHISYLWQHAGMRDWERLAREGLLEGPAARFFAAVKPVEELYDVKTDPWQVKNLASDPAHRDDLLRLRRALEQEMRAAGDLGLLSEREIVARSAGRSPHAIGTDPRLNPLDELLAAAELANRRDPADLDTLVAVLRSEDSAVRRWGAIGLVALGAAAAPARGPLRDALDDASAEVRILAAETLAATGEIAPALAVLGEALRDRDPFTRLAALASAQRLGAAALPLVPTIREARIEDPRQRHIADYVNRLVDYLPERLAAAGAAPRTPSPSLQ